MSKFGLLIVDLQPAFFPPDELVDEIQIAMQSMDCVVFTKFVNLPNSLFRQYLNWHACTEDDIRTDIAMHTGEHLVLTKHGYGLTSEHVGMLKAQKMDAWYVAGVDTASSVLACAFSLWDHGVRCGIRSDLTYSSSGLLLPALQISSFNFAPNSKGD